MIYFSRSLQTQTGSVGYYHTDGRIQCGNCKVQKRQIQYMGMLSDKCRTSNTFAEPIFSSSLRYTLGNGSSLVYI